MPFGLENAPATFQNMMNVFFGICLDNGTVVYIDDNLNLRGNRRATC